MYFDFCVGGKPDFQAKLGLDTIFHVLGDVSYITPHKEVTRGKTYFVYTTKGEGQICYDGATYLVHQGDCLFAQPTFSFSYRCNADAWHFWWFEFHNSGYMLSANQVLTPPVNDFKISLFEQSLLYAKSERWDIAESLLDACCGIIQHALLIQKQPQNTKILRDADTIIRDNLCSITVEELANALNLNKRTMLNMFHTALGISPKQFITKMRMDTALQMLECTSLPISAIALQLGFSSQFHFSRAFKEAFGTPPQQYRLAVLNS